ncbi:hypothetical protein JSR02_00365 [Candidatus Vidania fulgoroideae]|uniref:Uncharacterized protein n=1 Tax=Candidatus Vidania fulgoroideorum TaxID=881286 RepID=A0A974X7A4_9PROT|nr:hypothetical protein JSR02_00365 [Candidatus Vidania fulgoroideae]
MIYLIKYTTAPTKLIKSLITKDITIILKPKQLKTIEFKNKLKTTTTTNFNKTNSSLTLIKKLHTTLQLMHQLKHKSYTLIITKPEKINNIIHTFVIKNCNFLLQRCRCFYLYTENALNIINKIKHTLPSITINSPLQKLNLVFEVDKNNYTPPTNTTTLQTLHQLTQNSIKKKSHTCIEQQLITTITKNINDKKIFI